MPSPRLAPLVLTRGERESLALRARIVLACAEGQSSTQVTETSTAM
jgi:hypothetical protein